MVTRRRLLRFFVKLVVKRLYLRSSQSEWSDGRTGWDGDEWSRTWEDVSSKLPMLDSWTSEPNCEGIRFIEISASLDDTKQIVEGKITEMDRESQNIQV